MDITTMTLTVFNLIYPIITSKSGKKIRDDFSDAANGTLLEIWEKVKPLFIIEDAIKEAQENPDDLDIQGEIRSILKRKIKNDDLLKDKLKELINKLEKQSEDKKSILIKKSKNVITGNISNVSGNVQIGDQNANE